MRFNIFKHQSWLKRVRDCLARYIENWQGEHNCFYFASKSELHALNQAIEGCKAGAVDLEASQWQYIKNICRVKKVTFGKFVEKRQGRA